MRITVYLVPWLFVVVLFVTEAGAATENETTFSDYSTQSGEAPNNSSDHDQACACCMDCRAATKEVKPERNGVPATNGCRDCCEKCGDEELPLDKERIPEIIK